MSIDIRLKHSAVNGKAPQPSDLSDGELALNINDADPAIYLKDSAGAVRRMDAGVAYTKTETDTALALKADLASPALTGTPTAPTAAAGTNTTQIATTEFVTAAVAVENLWDRTGTTLSPATAGDDVDLGTGDLSAAAGTFSGLAKSAGLESSGDVLVGGTLPADPEVTLHADGSAAFRSTALPPNSSTNSTLLLTNGQAPGSGYFLQCYSALNPDQTVSAGTHAAQLDTNGTLSLLNPTVGSIASERRLKENIVPIDPAKAWDTIKTVPYYSYNFIGLEKANVVYGPMVDEVPADMVINTDRSDDQGVIRTYDNGMLQARLYTALQTALTRIEALEAKVAALTP